MRRQLEHRARRGFVGPAISVLGVRDRQTTLLRHGFDRPTDVALGFELPPSHGAVIVVASSVVARRERLDHGELAVAVDRAGTEICMVTDADGITETYRPCGWLIDACRRSVGLATRPEVAHPLAFPLALWLDRLMVEVVHARRPITWDHARASCPVPARWSSADPEQLGTTLASITPTWPRLRRAAMAGGLLPVPIEPAHAAWMDDSMFARWCLGFFPDLDDLRADVEFIAPPDVVNAVERTVAAAYGASS